ncbi:hypothetical protein F4778DRAFT_187539 [Xylariomycetidae sp. FL2044]|nr:hypothetical protein F4778DRAFT_187539 [Xylariomycetidae sp. FL2044]
MDLSPPSLTRSPVSSPNTNCSESPSLDYPSPDLVDPLYKIASMYEQSCAAVSSNMDSGNSLPPLDAMTSADWNGTTLLHAASSAGTPSILTADYDPYTSGYEPSMNTPYPHDIYSSHPAQAHALVNTPPPLPSTSSRSPDPSSRHSFAYHHSASPIPRIKMETAGSEYSSGSEISQYPSPRSTHALPVEPGSYGSNAGTSCYLPDLSSSAWPKSEFSSLEPDPYYAGANHAGSGLAQDRRQHLRGPRAPPRRQPRKLTTKEEANYECKVKGCGKLFSRSYNFKAHMETHDEKREYPFPCMVPECNKKFVRKTDLQRHNQSVHMKERNHKCDYCGRMFARKDTLRRHMEDGCSKRFDIGTLDLRSQGYDSAYNGAPRSLGSSTSHLGASSAQLPPMVMSQVGSHSLPAHSFTKR